MNNLYMSSAHQEGFKLRCYGEVLFSLGVLEKVIRDSCSGNRCFGFSKMKERRKGFYKIKVYINICIYFQSPIEYLN